MNADSVYLGAFGGALACLFVLNLILTRVLREPRFLAVEATILGFACFFLLDRAVLSYDLGVSEMRTWMLTSVTPLLLSLVSICYLISVATNMKGTAPRTERFLMFITAILVVAALAYAAPVAMQKLGYVSQAARLETRLVPLCFAIVSGVVSFGWLLSLVMTPIELGERRSFSVAGVLFMIAFLGTYSLILYDRVHFSEGLSNQMRIAVLAATGFFMLAVYRRSHFRHMQRDRQNAFTRSEAQEMNDKQASHTAISQAHLMQVLKREKKLQAELREREAQQMEALKAAKEAADETARNKASFLAFMSHEIRTPLNGIMGMVRLLMNTDVSEQQRDYIQTLNYSGDALLALVNDTLDISKIEAGQLVLESIDFDLQRLISSIIMLMSARASEKNLMIRSDIGPGVPKFIQGDPTRLRQIMLNLINNAIKFTETGGITVKVQVLEGAPANATRLRMDIQDTGPGISEEGRSRLFKQYSQVDTSTTRLYGGTGLGLSICKQLVQAMDGDIGVDSEVGKGSSFWFVVDFLNTEADSLGEMHGKTPGTPVLSAMVIEDNEIHQKVIGGYLRLDGHKTTLVGSAEEGLDKLATEDFDVLLMDVNLPGIDGNEATRRIRQMANPIKRTVPIIAITGNTSPLDIDECRQSGMNDFVGKPVDPDALRSTVLSTHKVWLEERKLAETAASPPGESAFDHKMRVLVVDDSEINQRVIAGFLQAAGHTLTTAASGEKAVSLASTGEYDLILMDVMLPGITGLEASRRIRALKDVRAASVPIAAITGNTSSADMQACRDAGMTDFLGKPIDPDQLDAVLERARHASGPATESLDDYLPQEIVEDAMLDEAVLGRLTKAFNLKALSGLMEEMVAESKPIIAAMGVSVEEENLTALRTQAHTLKGMALTLGVTAVGELAADIETMVQRGTGIATLADMVTKMNHVFDQSCTAIERWRDRNVKQLT